ncbi:type III secretion system chaperone family protein, partial [Rhodococcus chondri]
NWHRAALAKQEYLGAIDVVHGVRRGEEFILFDIEETATIVAVRRKVGSDVDIDLRLKSTAPPKDSDMNLLGSIGPRIVFATDLEIARRVCDQRMVAFTQSIPPHVQMLWSENEWTLGSIPVGSNGREWDAAIETVARLSGILHVLPPVVEPAGVERSVHDPGRPSAQR